MVKYIQRGEGMYILKVLVEHSSYQLDRTFDYLSNDYVETGCRVSIPFGRQKIIGYVTECYQTDKTKHQLEEEKGFRYSFIIQIIDQKPLLNKELQELAKYMAKQTLSTQISCLQCMLPIQLKPKSQKTVGIKYEKVISFIKEMPLKTPKQQEALTSFTPCKGLSIFFNGFK